MTDTVPKYCSIETVAREIDCSETAVRDYVRKGILPQPCRIGGLVRYKWEDVEKAIEGLHEAERPDDPIMRAVHGT